jgi:hypothetical protein
MRARGKIRMTKCRLGAKRSQFGKKARRAVA